MKETFIIELSNLEGQFLQKVLSTDEQINLTQNALGYFLKLTNENAVDISEKIKEFYVFWGFDSNYNLTDDGRLLEKIVDKLSDAGL